MLSFLKSLFSYSGKRYDKQLSKQLKEQYDHRNRAWTEHGYWKNVGTPLKDSWVWVDLDPPDTLEKPLHVSVIRTGDKQFLIVTDEEELPYAVESVKCVREKDVKVSTEILTSYYGCLGQVTVESNTSKGTF